MSELTEKQVVRSLKRLEKGWPKSLWLWSANGTLCLMRCGPDGEHVFTSNGRVDPAYLIQRFNIDNDGGDW
jgi:hypothetical protein